MAKGRILGILVMGLLLGSATHAAAQPSPAQMLSIYKPRQQNIVMSTPTPEEQKSCEVKLEKGTVPNSSGWVLLDGKKQPLRRYFDSDGDGKIDIWSYYKDGVEVYRDIDTNKNNTPDQCRWLNTAGSKWGLDFNEDGKIDAWKMIAPEEVAQEVFLAVQTRDFARLKALFITEAEITGLKVPQADAARIRDTLAKAEKKFGETVTAAKQLTTTANFVRVESGPPTCLPMDSSGAAQDIIRYTGRAILYEGADKKHDWIQTGPMILVGQAWKLTDAPMPGDLIDDPNRDERTGGGILELKNNPALAALVKELSELDEIGKKVSTEQGKNPPLAAHMLKRAQVVEQILAKVTKAEDRDAFLRQLSDNLGSAAQAGDAGSLPRLEALRDQVAKTQPGSMLAGYVTFRRLWAEYAPKLVTDDAKNMQKVQEQWLDQLSKFVQAFPKAEDTPDALMHLAMGSEFNGKEEEAKRWYQQMTTNFPTHPMVDKARGAIRRLDVVGQPMQLAGKTLTGADFDVSKLAGKVVLVYYWASYCDSVCVGEFARLKQLQANYGSKGFEVVGVNLDDTKEAAEKFLAANPLPGTHLFATGPQTGLNNVLATHYGITGLPMMFLVGKDGRVISRTIQIGNLEDAVKKAQQ